MIAVITDAGGTLRVVRPLLRAGAVLVAGSGVVERRCPGAVRGPDGTAFVATLVDQYMNETGTHPSGRCRRRAAGRTLRARTRSPWHVWHAVLRLAPTDPRLSEDEWSRVARRTVADMGFERPEDGVFDEAFRECRWAGLLCRAGTVGDSTTVLHLVANVVREDGRVWSCWQDERRLRGACERIEDALGLRRTGRGAEART